MKKKTWSWWTLVLFSLLLSGCTTTITNITPRTEKRSKTGFYPFEVVLDSRQRTIKKETIKPYVLIGDRDYPMRRTPRLDNRWEALVEIPPDREFVNYRFKFNYEYNCFPHPEPGSKLSSPYQLHILDK